MWQPDGWGARGRIGILVPHFDLGVEVEIQAMAPEGVTIHSTRVRIGVVMPVVSTDPGIALAPVRSWADPPEIDDAAEMLADLPLHAMVYGFFSSSYTLGVEGDRALQARLEQRTHGIPVVIPGLAAVAAVRAVGARRIALIDPPWFSPDLNEMGADYFRSQQIEVVYNAPVTGLPSSQHDQHPGRVHEWVRSHIPEDAEAVVIGGNGFRTVGTIEALEEDTGRPILTANSVSLWNALRVARVNAPVTHYGRLFGEQLPAR